MALVLGLDEAGRGCVLGPLVLGAFLADESAEKEMREKGVRDSKMIPHPKRVMLRSWLAKKGVCKSLEISAVELNELMKRKSLNEIEAMKIGEIVNGYASEFEVERVFVDSPDAADGKFAKRIRKYLKNGRMELVCENKAEDKFPVVGAASVIAKVKREDEIERIKKVVGEDFGSGYSSDEATIEYLKKNITRPELKPFLRTKWKTTKDLMVIQHDLSKYW